MINGEGITELPSTVEDEYLTVCYVLTELQALGGTLGSHGNEYGGTGQIAAIAADIVLKMDRSNRQSTDLGGIDTVVIWATQFADKEMPGIAEALQVLERMPA